jgi:hypothetical protein
VRTEEFGFRDVAATIWQTLSCARMQLKLGAALMLAIGALVVAVNADRLSVESPADVSDVVITVVVLFGAAISGIISTLFRAGEEAATGRRTPEDWYANPTAFHNMLLIIPTGAAIGAALLWASAGLVTATSLATASERWPVVFIPDGDAGASGSGRVVHPGGGGSEICR